MGKIIKLTKEQFSREVLESKIPVLVDFFASWCGHCTKLAPVLDDLADELGDKVKIVTINIEEDRALAQEYGVISLPTMIIFQQGMPVQTMMGFMPKEKIADKINLLL